MGSPDLGFQGVQCTLILRYQKITSQQTQTSLMTKIEGVHGFDNLHQTSEVICHLRATLLADLQHGVGGRCGKTGIL